MYMAQFGRRKKKFRSKAKEDGNEKEGKPKEAADSPSATGATQDEEVRGCKQLVGLVYLVFPAIGR